MNRPPGHSTETAVLRILFDILLAFDRGVLAALNFLDLTAAFDIVDHHILLLLQCRQLSFSINDVAVQWFQSYLPGRSQYVAYDVGTTSQQLSRFCVVCGRDQC